MASSQARASAAIAKPRSLDARMAEIDAKSARPVPTTKTPGPSALSGWPQQKTLDKPIPPIGISDTARAILPVITPSTLGGRVHHLLHATADHLEALLAHGALLGDPLGVRERGGGDITAE